MKVYAHADDGTKLRVFWERPDSDNGGIILWYVIEWTTNDFVTVCDGNPCPKVLVEDLPSSYPWDYNISGLIAEVEYKIRVVAENDQGRFSHYYVDGFAVTQSSSTLAIAHCEEHIEECSPSIIPRALPLEPVVTIAAIGSINEFTDTSITVTWFTGSIANSEAVDKWKVEWDTRQL